MPSTNSSRNWWLTTLAAFALPFLLYLKTLAPTIFNLDSAEFTTAVETAGIVRATGYPTYLLVGRLWSHLPIDDPGFRLNLLSAFCGALTLALAVRILRRLGAGPWAALGALGLLALSRFFWALSLIAEVYTPHTACMAGVILLLLRWAERPTPVRLGLATLLMGLSAGNHMATVLLAPGCLWFVLRTAPRLALKPRSLALAAAGLVLGLSIYLYLPYLYSTQPAFNYAGSYDSAGIFHPVDLSTLRGIWWLMTGRVFAGQMLAYGAGGLPSQLVWFGGELWGAFLVLGVGPALLGLVVAWRRHRIACEALLIMFLVSAGFYIDFAVADKETMFLPAYLIWSLWIAIGLQWLLQWVGETHRMSSWISPATASALLRTIIVSAVLFALVWNYPLVDLSRDMSSRRLGESILRTVKPDALLVGFWGTVPVVQYLQLVEGTRPDVFSLNRFLISEADLQTLILREIERRPVYFGEPLGPLFEKFESRRAGPIFRLTPRPRPRTIPEEAEVDVRRHFRDGSSKTNAKSTVN